MLSNPKTRLREKAPLRMQKGQQQEHACMNWIEWDLIASQESVFTKATKSLVSRSQICEE